MANNKGRREIFIPPEGQIIQALIDDVGKKQNTLAMALRNGQYNKTKKLVKELSRDRQLKAYAVYRTISNTGSRTKGYKDNKRPTAQVEYNLLMTQVYKIVQKPQSYRATRRTYLQKPQGGWRPISVPTYLDRAVQQLYNLTLDVFQEETADSKSFGFRKHRSPGWANKSLTLTLWANPPPKNDCWNRHRKMFR